MKILFYTFADPCVKDYLVLNESLKQIKEPFYFLCSGDIDIVVKKLYPNAIIIKGKNHLQQKFIQLGSELLDVDFDVLVKIDLDAILFNYQEVLDIASKCPPESILGNKRTLGDRIYIRGGCNACHASVIKRFVIKGFHQTFKGMDFDIPFCIQSKANLVDYQIFEISEKYSGKLPVWHPLQNTTKLIQFRKCIEIYNKENNQ